MTERGFVWHAPAPVPSRLATLALLLSLASCAREDATSPVKASASALEDQPRLSPTRQLRRLWLATRGHEPTLSDYQAALDAADAGSFEPFLTAQVDAALASNDFRELARGWGHDYLKVGDFKRGSVEGTDAHPFKTAMAVFLDVCPAGSTHAGALVLGDDLAQCDVADATVRQLEPWWTPGTQVSVLGRAGDPAPDAGGEDCGVLLMGQSTYPVFPNEGCSCGPNLLHCRRKPVYGSTQYPRMVDSTPYRDGSLRRLVWEEPARLFEHVVVNDKPFTDLVLGDYLVAPRNLQHVYWRWGRMNGDASLDSSTWWRSATDDWQEVVAESINPRLLKTRTYRFDPRVELGEPLGLPAAGMLTQLGPQSWYPRERVRAARYLEIFACRSFAAPDPSIVFTPAFSRDPHSEGSCQHCHQTLDPAAIHFKRIEVEDDRPSTGQGYPNLGGIGLGRWTRQRRCFADPNSPGGIFWYQPYGRWHVNFAHDTFLTPVPEASLGPVCMPGSTTGNPDARFLDFLPPGQKLFGLESDGTIGPLGFGKLVVESGEFDRCAVRNIFEKFAGRPLDVTREGELERALVDQFKANGRQVKPLVRFILARDEFRRGL